MKPGFVRVKLIELDPASFQHVVDTDPDSEHRTASTTRSNVRTLSASASHPSDNVNVLLEPICAVNIKEIVKRAYYGEDDDEDDGRDNRERGYEMKSK